MSAILMDISVFGSALSSGKLVLTANNRQRNQILRAYNNTQTGTQWRAPRVETLRQWQERCWLDYQLAGLTDSDLTLINTAQREALWHEVIQHHGTAEQLLQPARLAAHAEAARAALDGWCCPVTELEQWQHSTDETTNFSAWHQSFQDKLLKLRLATSETVQALLIDAFTTHKLSAETEALLYGFDDLTPLTEKLIQCALPSAQIVEGKPSRANPLLRCEADSDAEILHAAMWADQILAKQPDAVIGIVVPNLGQIRDRVESLLQSVFTPLDALPEYESTVAPYNFSAGTPLANAPIIDSALSLLSGLNRQHTPQSASDFLNNQYVGDAQSEWHTRTLAINHLNRIGALSYAIGDITYALSQACQRTECESALYSGLETSAQRRRLWSASKQPEHWQSEIHSLLDAFSWPGCRRLTSIEHQQAAQFFEALSDLNSIGKVQPLWNFRDYVSFVIERLRRTPFQAQTPDSPIQILGTLEAAGLHFSHVWVLGMHHGAWPPAAAPNPLLPVQLQRDWNMPKSSSERELHYASRLTERLATSAATVIFSYPVADGDRHLRPSQLIEERCAASHEKLEATTETSYQQNNYATIAHSSRLELIECGAAPEPSSRHLPGGSGILKSQAACPFSALARYRLGARTPNPPTLGFSALERGNILHQVLANFWQNVQDSDSLNELSEQDIRQHLTPLIDNALRDTVHKSRRKQGLQYIQLERERLVNLVTQWLELEKTRPKFAVCAIEQRFTLSLQDFDLTVQVDRIDTLADGRQLIIDYKTGATSTNDWKQDRFFDPQLPLYACNISPDSNGGISFATINSSQTGFLGWGEDIAIEGIKPPEQANWSAQLQAWQSNLQVLLNEIQQGVADVQYRSLAAQRFEEDLKPLNRIDEQLELEHWSVER